MTSVLLLQTADPEAPDLRADFTAAGFTVLGQGDCAHLMRETLRQPPDVLVCWAPQADDALLDSLALLQREHPLPVLVFTRDSDVGRMQRALDAGVHAWVVQGYGTHRLRPLVAQASARQAQLVQLQRRIAELEARLEERKLLDKAKGILMRSRELSEDEAFRLLRSASMQGNRRVGQLSQQVIDTARIGEAINRAGQQRMLSQRLVKLYALACSRTDGPAAALLMRESVARVENNFKQLEAELSPQTFGDLLAAGRAAWLALRQGLETAAPQESELPRLDALAEAVLLNAQALVAALVDSGVVSPVGVVDTAGRQRMLSQRMAKLALLRMGAPDPATLITQMETTDAAFEEGLRTLQEAPLSTPKIRAILQEGRQAWNALLAALPEASRPAGRLRLAAASEELLEIFDRLTQAYQHSVEVVMGERARG